MPPILYLFALGNLVVGTGAFVLTGILTLVSQSLNVSVAAAGQAMTAYALASALLAPLLVIATVRWPRKAAVALALALFTVGSVLCALSDSLPLLLAGRVLMGMGSAFSALAAGVVVALVPIAMRGRALSISFLGISLSYAIGLPLGAWLGFNYGWPVPLWGVAVGSAGMLLALMAALPLALAAGGASFAGLGPVLRQGAVLRVLARSLLYFVAIFSVFAYIGPVLQALSPMSTGRLSFTLVLFGVSGIVGTVLGGWVSDRFGPVRSLRVQLVVLIVLMALLPLTKGNYALCAAVLVAWGVAGFGLMAPQQSRIASLAGPQAPLLLSLNGSMLYVGTALGAVFSGAASGALGFENLAWVGLPFAALALLTLAWDGAE
jgi:predicted MFS family arabinose efflux permease